MDVPLCGCMGTRLLGCMDAWMQACACVHVYNAVAWMLHGCVHVCAGGAGHVIRRTPARPSSIDTSPSLPLRTGTSGGGQVSSGARSPFCESKQNHHQNWRRASASTAGVPGSTAAMSKLCSPHQALLQDVDNIEVIQGLAHPLGRRCYSKYLHKINK